MPQTNDADEFRQRWNDHVDELNKLKHSLPVEQFDEFDIAVADLRDFIDNAADELEDD